MLVLPAASALDAALGILDRPDGVILAPTETVYGLICAADHAEARERIYRLKHRPAEKLLANFVPSVGAVSAFVREIPETARIFAAHFCPGPITLVIPDGRGGTFGFRIPDHPFMLALLRAYGKAVASTSANRSGQPAALSIPQAEDSLDGEPDLAVDGGIIPASSKASTVVQVSADGSWNILRPGPISETELESVL